MDPKNYQSLPDQQDETFVWKARDKNDPTTYKWETKVNQQGREASSNSSWAYQNWKAVYILT